PDFILVLILTRSCACIIVPTGEGYDKSICNRESLNSQRLNRKIKEDDLVLKKCAPTRRRTINLADYYVVDIHRNVIVDRRLDSADVQSLEERRKSWPTGRRFSRQSNWQVGTRNGLDPQQYPPRFPLHIEVWSSTVQKSVLLAAIQKGIHRHDFSYFVDER